MFKWMIFRGVDWVSIWKRQTSVCAHVCVCVILIAATFVLHEVGDSAVAAICLCHSVKFNTHTMQHIASNRRHKFMTFLPHTSWNTAQVTLLTLGTNFKSETNYTTDRTFLYPSAISVGAMWHLRGPGGIWQGENTCCIFICALERAVSEAEGQRSYSYCRRHLLKPLHVSWMSIMTSGTWWRPLSEQLKIHARERNQEEGTQ